MYRTWYQTNHPTLLPTLGASTFVFKIVMCRTDDLLEITYILTCRDEVLRRICIVHIQPRKRVQDQADYTAPTQ